MAIEIRRGVAFGPYNYLDRAWGRLPRRWKCPQPLLKYGSHKCTHIRIYVVIPLGFVHLTYVSFISIKTQIFLMLKSTHCGSTQISAVFQSMHFRDTFKNHRNQVREKKKKAQGAKEIWGITGNEIYTAGGFTKCLCMHHCMWLKIL